MVWFLYLLNTSGFFASKLASRPLTSKVEINPRIVSRCSWTCDLQRNEHRTQGYQILTLVSSALTTMDESLCSHLDVRTFNDTVCCLSCGAVRDLIHKQPSALPCGTPIHPSELGSQPYRYDVLDRNKDEIRLVVLHAGEESEPISCRILIWYVKLQLLDVFVQRVL